MPITKQDIKCLKHADSVCFDWMREDKDPNVQRHFSGKSQIRAILREDHSDTGYEQTHYILCDVQFDIYELDPTRSYPYQHTDKIPHSCFDMIHSPGFDYIWLSIRDQIREGDELTLRWLSSGNGYLTGAKSTVMGANGTPICVDEPLFLDEIQLIITRANGKRLQFRVGHNTCVNNSARTIRMTKMF